MVSVSERVKQFGESVIREMTRLANRFGAVNLAQGMPDFDPPPEILEAACQAIRDGNNQYAITWGAPILRQAIAEKARRFNGIDCNPDEHITVCCGATECMMSAMMAIVNPGDEVVIFQPFYENYGPDGILSGAKPVWVTLNEPDWTFDPDELRRAFGPKTKAIIVNTPNNPTGRVFTKTELELIAELCIEHDAFAITDEIYEHIIYNATPHISIATLPGMAERTITISGHSKTFSVTGWRLGYCIANKEVTTGIRKVHDFLTVGAPHPLQIAGAKALTLGDDYYAKLHDDYSKRGEVFLPYLRDAGFQFTAPEGAYYVMSDFSQLSDLDDTAFVDRMIREVGVAGVPGSSFYFPAELGRKKVRFMFAKREATLHEAGKRLQRCREVFRN